jgi:hypothetical protein
MSVQEAHNDTYESFVWSRCVAVACDEQSVVCARESSARTVRLLLQGYRRRGMVVIARGRDITRGTGTHIA